MRFADKVVVITGAGGAVGPPIVARLLAEGARVVATDKSVPDREHWGEATVWVQADLRERASGKRIIDAALEAFGRVDVVIANAALATDGDLGAADEDYWADDITVNLTANVGLVGAAVAVMRQQRSGVIIAVSSVNAHADFGTPVYSAAKAGLESLMRSVAGAYGPEGIRANSIVLGTIATEGWRHRVAKNPEIFEILRAIFPLRRIGTPADVASLISFVASDEASWMTGASIVLDGGLLIAHPDFRSQVFGA